LRNHPWAGQYSWSSGLSGVTLTLAPDNGFTVRQIADIGLMDQNHGTVEWDGDRIKLTFAFDWEDDVVRASGNPLNIHISEYKPIRWEERVYLIPLDRIIPFCDAVNAGREPRNHVIGGTFFLRRDDEKKTVTGKPELPKEFMPYLRGEEPIIATVVSIKDVQEEERVGSTIQRKATVVVDKGKADGLLPGMILYVMDQEGVSMVTTLVTLTMVGETQSEGEYIGRPSLPPSSLRSLEAFREAREAQILEGIRAPLPEPGWQFSTQRQER